MRTRSAFSLVELLVVIGIIGVLIAMLMPALSGAREAGRRVQCAANLHQLGIALVNYATQNNDSLPAWSGWRGGRVRPRCQFRMREDVDGAGWLRRWQRK